ncbi:hypothetical protein DFH27DRAFT_577195 [Peziza echinospora]|nr:hypothetical protein DFH27DRAFT_577195 [Peziza echinospora]
MQQQSNQPKDAGPQRYTYPLTPHKCLRRVKYTPARHPRERELDNGASSVLRFSASMATCIHESTRQFVKKILLQPRSPLQKLLTPVDQRMPASKKVENGPEAQKGEPSRRTADLTLTQRPEHMASLRNGFEDDEVEFERGAGTIRAAVAARVIRRLPMPIAATNIVVEIGYSEPYKSIRKDAEDWLISSRGKIKLCVLVDIDYATIPAASCTSPGKSPSPTTIASTTASAGKSPSPKTIASATASAQNSSPRSAMTDYEEAAGNIEGQVDRYMTPFTAFLELHEHDSSTKSTRLRGPRIPLVTNNVVEERIAVPLCRADFGLEEYNTTGDGSQMIETNWGRLAQYMLAARMEDAYARKMEPLKLARMAQKRSEGDIGGEYMDEIQSGDEVETEPESEEVLTLGKRGWRVMRKCHMRSMMILRSCSSDSEGRKSERAKCDMICQPLIFFFIPTFVNFYLQPIEKKKKLSLSCTNVWGNCWPFVFLFSLV